MSSNKKKSFRRINLILLAIALVLGICVFVGRKYLKLSFFESKYELQGPSNCFLGKNGNIYVIDNGRKTVVIVNDKYEYKDYIEGGSENDNFYYASLVCDDLDGNIYIADYVYSGQGTRIKQERIQKFNKSRKFIETVYQIDYEEDNAPYQYGNILSVEYSDNIVKCLVEDGGYIYLVEVYEDGNHRIAKKWTVNDNCFDVCYDKDKNRLVVATKNGEIKAFDDESNEEILYSAKDNSIIRAIRVSDSSKIYFTELLGMTINEMDEDGMVYPKRMENSFFTMDVCGDDYATTDLAGIYKRVYDGKGLATEKYFTDLKVDNLAAHKLTWIALIIVILCLLFVVTRTLYLVIRKIKDRENAVKVAMIIIAAVACSVTISALAIKTMTMKVNSDSIDNLSLFTNLLEERIDVELIDTITDVSDYDSIKYDKVKMPLDEMIVKGYDEGVYYYYILYRKTGNVISVIMDFENGYTVNYPACEYGNNDYSMVLGTGNSKIVENEVSSYGTWTFKLNPIYDSNGNIVALLEVGVNVDETTKKVEALKEDIIYTTITAVIVIVMLLLELLFLIENKNRRKIDRDNPSTFVPLRSMVFLMYLATSVQDSFIAQLCNKLYAGNLPISEGIAVTLPISAELFFAALSSLVSGTMINKIGTKVIMVTGTTLSMLGYSICGFVEGYYSLLVGKSLLGLGLGMVVVTANTLAALGKTEEDKGKAFAGINAGLLAGITVGDGLGSIILTFSNYGAAYRIGLIIMIVAFAIAIKSKKAKPSHDKEEVEINFGKFLFNKRVLPFFLLILMPFMIMLSYREYFFPLYGEENGLSEVAIGRIFLFCGLIIIYLGPILGEELIEKLGSKKAMIFSSFIMAINVGIFIVYPHFISAVAGILILSINISFAYTCQYAYFASLPECDKYGEGNAMGIYSMIENIGQTVGPMIFGSVLVLGYTDGIKIIGTAFFSLFVFYLMFAVSKKEKKDGGRENG